MCSRPLVSDDFKPSEITNLFQKLIMAFKYLGNIPGIESIKLIVIQNKIVYLPVIS